MFHLEFIGYKHQSGNVNKREFIRKMLGTPILNMNTRKSGLGSIAARENRDSSGKQQEWSWSRDWLLGHTEK